MDQEYVVSLGYDEDRMQIAVDASRPEDALLRAGVRLSCYGEGREEAWFVIAVSQRLQGA